MEISPPLVADSPLYRGRREQFSQDKAPMRKLTRYVSPVAFDW